MLRMFVGFGLLIAALGCAIAAYGVFSTPAPQIIQSNTDAEQTATDSISGERQKVKLSGFWQWLEDREGAVTALSTVLLMIFTLVLALATIYLYRSGEHSVEATRKVAAAAKESAEAAKLAQRPWVSVKAEIGPRGLFFDVNGANLDLIFWLKNTGNTPAVTVRIEGSPRIDVKTNDRIAELEKVCAEAKGKEQNPKMVGYTIFPGDTLRLNYAYSFANKELLEEVSNKLHGFILPVVIGCVDYFITFGEPTHHQSRFVYDISALSTTEGGGRVIIAVNVTAGDVSANNLSLNPWFEAGSFQAD